MSIFQRLIVCLFIAMPVYSIAQKKIKLASPDGRLLFSIRILKTGPAYSISFKEKAIIENAGLTLDFKESGLFRNNLATGKPIFREATESYELIVGKTKQVNDKFKEVRIPLFEKKAPLRKIQLVVRAFNGGIAFRYEFPEQANRKSYSLTNEATSFSPAGNPRLLTLMLPNYTTSHEGEYSSLYWKELPEDTLMDLPTLFEFPGNIYMAITEAALVDYAGMYLMKQKGRLISKLSPLPDEPEILVKANLLHKSPWRVLLISDRPGALIESNIITSLNEPCRIKDLSWIKPGKTTFPWWNGTIVPDTSFAPGNNFETNKYYIDFCARNGIEYHSVVEYGGHEWYVSDGEYYQPGPNTDITKPVPGLDMQRVCDYAREKGVGIRVWTHWKALYPKLEEAFTLFERWGIKGLMVDFMDRDDQEMIRIQEEILQRAAAHKLHIQFHGSHKPTGLSRTYPNEFTREGTLNYEVNKWAKRVDPDHDLNIVYTRMIAGPTDYHLGGFRAVPDSLWRIQYIRPLMMGTRCHMLAMYVVLENYQGMLCDYPQAYEGEPGFDFLKIVPTVWDETKVLDGKLREFITIARRKGSDWFIGSITGNQRREVKIDFNFLKSGNWEATVYSDAKDAAVSPNKLVKESRMIQSSDTVSVTLAAGGGAVIHLKKH